MRRAVVVTTMLVWAVALGAGCANEPEIEGRTLSDWVNLLRHQDWAIQEEAQDALVRLGPKAVPYLRRTLKSKDPTLRRGVTRTLGRIGPKAKAAIPSLLARISREEVPIIRVAVLDALAQIDPAAPEVQAEFQKRLRDVDADVRAAAQRGIDKLKPEPEPEPVPDKPDQPPAPAGKGVGSIQAPEFELRDAVRVQLDTKVPGVAFGLVAEVVRGDRRAAVIWPAIKDGKILDDDIVALVFERKGDNPWEFQAEVGPLKGDHGPVELAAALGGADNQRVIRACGVPRAELSAYLSEHGQAFQAGLAGGKPEDAMAAYEKLTLAFSFSRVAYDDALPEMLINKAFANAWKVDPEDKSNRVKAQIQVGDKTSEAELEIRPCGTGVVIGDMTK